MINKGKMRLKNIVKINPAGSVIQFLQSVICNPKQIVLTIILFIFIFLPPSFIFAYQKKVTSEKVALEFVISLGSQQFDKSYRMLSEHARKTIIKKAIERFSDIDNTYYLPTDMDFKLQTNEDGHRTVLFEDLTKDWCARAGIQPISLCRANVVLLKGDNDRADLKILAGGGTLFLTMKKEAGEWKAAWYPYEK